MVIKGFTVVKDGHAVVVLSLPVLFDVIIPSTVLHSNCPWAWNICLNSHISEYLTFHSFCHEVLFEVTWKLHMKYPSGQLLYN